MGLEKRQKHPLQAAVDVPDPSSLSALTSSSEKWKLFSPG
jgi:hypothetical protein